MLFLLSLFSIPDALPLPPTALRIFSGPPSVRSLALFVLVPPVSPEVQRILLTPPFLYDLPSLRSLSQTIRAFLCLTQCAFHDAVPFTAFCGTDAGPYRFRCNRGPPRWSALSKEKPLYRLSGNPSAAVMIVFSPTLLGAAACIPRVNSALKRPSKPLIDKSDPPQPPFFPTTRCAAEIRSCGSPLLPKNPTVTALRNPLPR